MYCSKLFKQITDRKTYKCCIESNHPEVLVKFKLISIKLYTTKSNRLVIDWKSVQENKDVKDVFNKKSLYSLMKN